MMISNTGFGDDVIMSMLGEIAKEGLSEEIIKKLDKAITEGKYDRETLEWVKTIVYYKGY